MSTTKAIAIINECAIRFGDRAFNSVDRDKWLSFMNERARGLATRLRLVKRRALFSIEADNELYTFPDNMVVMTRMEFTPTPNDRTTFRDLREMFEEEWRGATTNTYPTGDPTRYYADQGFFYLYPLPAASYTRGGRLTYWGLPNEVVNYDIDLQPFADSMKNALVEGMLSDAYDAIEKYDVAAKQEAKFEKIVAQAQLNLEDRSEDRRQVLMPRSRVRGYGGQV